MVINESKGRVNPRTHHPIGSVTKLPFFPCCLVVSTYPSEKWWTSSVGMIIPFPNFWKVIKAMFQTSNQPIYPWIKGRVNPGTNHPIGILKLPEEQGRPCNWGPWGPWGPCPCPSNGHARRKGEGHIANLKFGMVWDLLTCWNSQENGMKYDPVSGSCWFIQFSENI